MQKPAIPLDEDERLNTLNSLGLLDSPPDTRFDRFTRIAQSLFQVPIALVSLVDYDRQWFKSCRGLSASETSRDISFCGHAIHESKPLVVKDALTDPRFADNPLVTDEPKIRFYAGYPLRAPNGKKIGTLCIISDQARDFSREDEELLIDLGELVENEIRSLQTEIIDQLTGLYNFRGFINTLNQTLKRHRHADEDIAIVYIDLDGFKRLNIQHSHSMGDKVLTEFAELLLQAFYGATSIARLDNDNFAVLIGDSMLKKIHQPMQRLIEAVSIRNKMLQREYPLSFSMGMTKHNPEQHSTIDDFINDARSAMLVNKQSKAI